MHHPTDIFACNVDDVLCIHSHSKANPYSESFRVDVVQCLSSVPVLCHLLGQKGDTARLYTQAGINFQNAEKKIVGWLSDCKTL